MHLQRLYIKNFRSIQQLDLNFSKGKNVIIGRNNAGKSNIIRALDIVFGEYSPTYSKNDTIKPDFCSLDRNVDDESIENQLIIWCEISRNPGEELNHDALRKLYAFKLSATGFKHSDIQELCEEIITSPEDFNDGVWYNPNKNPNGFLKYINEVNSFAFCFWAKKYDDDQIERGLVQLFYNEDNQSWQRSNRVVCRAELLQAAIIPAFRDPNSQLRPNRWSWYGKLLQELTKLAKHTNDLEQAFRSVQAAGNEIFSDVNQHVRNTTLEIAFPNTEISFQFVPDLSSDIYKSCTIYIDDGHRSELGSKGAGIQSATIIGLFSYYTHNYNTQGSALLCLEEPELYLHPHARRVVCNRLDDFLREGNNQVVLTTHSGEFLKEFDSDVTVILVKKGRTGSFAKRIDRSRLRSVIFTEEQAELFFADKVIICEGYDTYLLREVAAANFPGDIDAKNISVVSSGGKDNLIKLAHLALYLGIECYILCDFDFLLRDQSNDAKAYDAKQHKSIDCLPLEFFSQSCIAGEFGANLLQEIRQVRSSLKKTNPQKFYTAKHIDELGDPQVSTLVTRLRSCGICILNGEIEHLSKTSTWMNPNKKLSFETIYDLNRMVRQGKNLNEMLDTAELDVFLAYVMNGSINALS